MNRKISEKHLEEILNKKEELSVEERMAIVESQIRPAMRSANRFEMANPNPVPPYTR